MVLAVLCFGTSVWLWSVSPAAATPTTPVGGYDHARCQVYSDNVNVAYLCWMNPATLNVEPTSPGASWGYTLSAWDALPDATVGWAGAPLFVPDGGGTPVYTTCSSGCSSFSEWHHDAHSWIPSGGVVYVSSACGNCSSVVATATGSALGVAVYSSLAGGYVWGYYYNGGLVDGVDETNLRGADWYVDSFVGDGDLAPSTWCGTLAVTSSDMGVGISHGDVKHLEFTAADSFNNADAGTAFAYRMQVTDPWTELAPSALFSWTSGTTWDYSTPPWAGTTVSGYNFLTGEPLQFRCVVDGDTRFFDFAGDADAAAPDPCNLVQVDWPSFPLPYGRASYITVRLPSGGLGGVDDEISAWTVTFDPLITADADPEDVETANSAKEALSGADATWPMQRGDSWLISVSPPRVLQSTSINLICTDTVGTRTFTPGLPILDVGGTDGAPSDTYGDRFHRCWQGATDDLSLTSPASWVTALVQGVGCVGQWLFLPLDSDVNAVKASVDAANMHAPISYLTGSVAFIYTTVTGSADSIEAHADDCLPLIGSSDVGGAAGFHLPAQCADIHGLAEGLGSVRSLEATLFWLLACYVIVRQTQSVLSA